MDMASVQLNSVGKTYPGGTRAVESCTLDIHDGEFLVLVGPSGCGKSTLLDVLADCKGSGVISGDIRLNGQPRPPNFRTVAAYVMQSDNTHTMLTVRETLNFAAELRLPWERERPPPPGTLVQWTL